MTRKRERHTALIDSLQAVLFPFQESEEEQESFTPEGRQRVDEWIAKLLRTPCSEPAFTDCQFRPSEGGE